jgi:hypothetical protein
MAWIELHQAIRDHRKVVQLSDALDMPEPHVVGHLSFLWLWAVDNASDGRLICSDRVVAKAAAWSGDARVFVDALIAAGFLDRIEDGVKIHDWDDYGGKLTAKREANAERQRKYREQRAERDEPDAPASRNGDVTVTSRARHTATVENSTVHNTFANAHATRARAHDAPGASDADFDRFCASYPPGRIGSKAATRAAFDLAVDADGAPAVFDGLDAWNACGQWQRGYVTKAETWLTDRNYAQAPPKDRPKTRTKKHDKPEPFVYPVERQ